MIGNIDIVTGGQAGDEGKGKICAYLASNGGYSAAVKVGGPNAGHTIVFGGKPYSLKSVPTAFVHPKTKLYLGAGSYIKVDWLLKELELTGVSDRFFLDEKVVIIEDRHTEAEKADSHLMGSVGSVGTGLGYAVRDRIERKEVKFAKDDPRLASFIVNVSEELNKLLDHGNNVLVEGTQGYRLSLLYGDYPITTSRDTTASTFLAEAGLGPRFVRDIYTVFKPYVSRVGPGALKDEILDPEQLVKYHTKGREVGSVSGRLRRIGAFEMDSALKATAINGTTRLAFTHIDLFENNFGKRQYVDLTDEAKRFCQSIYPLVKNYPRPSISILSTGPSLEDTIELRFFVRH